MRYTGAGLALSFRSAGFGYPSDSCRVSRGFVGSELPLANRLLPRSDSNERRQSGLVSNRCPELLPTCSVLCERCSSRTALPRSPHSPRTHAPCTRRYSFGNPLLRLVSVGSTPSRKGVFPRSAKPLASKGRFPRIHASRKEYLLGAQCQPQARFLWLQGAMSVIAIFHQLTGSTALPIPQI